MSTTETQLGLPYQEIGKGANRNDIREAAKETEAKIGRQTFFIPFEYLTEREGFNVRTEMGDIEALASDILANGLNTPLTVDLVKFGTTFLYYIDIGHRRFTALSLLNDRDQLAAINLPGLRNGMVECFVNQTDVDELTRIVRLFTSNHHKPLEPLEVAEVCLRLHDYFGKSSTAIGSILGMSRQSCDNYLLLARADDQVKQSVRSGGMSVTAAIAMIRKVKDKDLQNQIAEEASRKTDKKLRVKDVEKIAMPSEQIAGGSFEGDEEEEEEGDENDTSHGDELDDALEDFKGAVNGSGERTEHDYSKPIQSPYGATVVSPQPQSVKDFLDQSDPDSKQKEEYKLCQRVIGNLDKLDNLLSFLPKQQSEDASRLIGFCQKDMEVIREYVKKAK